MISVLPTMAESPLLLYRPEGRSANPRRCAYEGWAEMQREKKGFVLTISVLPDWLKRCAPNADPTELQLLVPTGGQSTPPAWSDSDIFAKPKVQSGPAHQVLLSFGVYRPETIIRLSALAATGVWVGLRSGRSRLALLAVRLRPLEERTRLPVILTRPWEDYRFVNWPQRLQLPLVSVRPELVAAMLDHGGWPLELLNQATLSRFSQSDS